ncbi:MAG: UdgX family uracil-DNA binding protein [Nitriliruptorales bacterium]|nr:UdgX family uracil-DNA binding protein [Nitriliruptorales bacterium]
MTQESFLPDPEGPEAEPEFDAPHDRERPDEPDFEPDFDSDQPANASAAALAATASTLDELREAAAGCRGCDLWQDALQTVFGEGPYSDAAAEPERIEMVFIGEQPGDREDVEGRPFVGPAGALLDRALGDAGIDRTKAYVTNTVKHFKWRPQPVRGQGFRGTGKRRIHQKPNQEQINACRPWLDAELGMLKPRLVVCLGATAAQALLGRSFRVTRQRGQLFDGPGGLRYTATVHPSSILRADSSQREAAYADFVDDLRNALAALS